ncbi:O-antigen ligase domain-containing protein [Aquisphaera insulae]|uniref:O-antigen ligase domain-containing protein n=1 Tax=Aquisphaera insulae TaxID=2712864 RepID=UPI0013ED9DF3|nr:O-antigen ligase domain-containing protein [Aquisphaera insulae]
MNPRAKILALGDRAACGLIAVLVLGSIAAFGGAVWWFRPFLAVAALLLVLVEVARLAAAGRFPLLKSPLTALGLLALGLAAFQLVPLPGAVARRISPAAHEAYGRGVLPDLVRADDPEAALPEAPRIRTPASLDRAATLRWLVGAAACLGIFWSVSHYADRLGRLYLVWGLVVGGFLLNATIAAVQVSNRGDGLYGLFLPGGGPPWAPTLDDLFESPTTTELWELPRATVAATAPDAGPGEGTSAGTAATATRAGAGAFLAPATPPLFGTMMASPGAFLAMGTLAMPLALAIVVHLLTPLGGRDSLADRLMSSGQGSLVLLLVLLMLPAAFVVGLIAGPWYSLPAALGLVVAGLPAAARPGCRGAAGALLLSLLVCLGMGGTLQARWEPLMGGPPPVPAPDPRLARALWSDGLEVARLFPTVGAGLGTFATLQPYFKDGGPSSTTAMSTLVQWSAEAGMAGVALLAAAALWSAWRIPGGLKRVGRGDRSLAHGLIGAALSFTLLAAVHWTVELSAVAISASALGGTWNRWLAGGTDLFVDRG